MKVYTCIKCGKTFEYNKHRKYCNECKKSKRDSLSEEELSKLRIREKARNKRHRLKVKELALNYKGHKCQICGYNKCYRALEFHHVDEATKKFGIGGKGYTRSIKDFKNELDKCILVCSNCHAEIHDGLIDISNISLEPENKNAFDKELKKEPKNKKRTLDKKIVNKLSNSKALNSQTELNIIAHYKSRKVKRPDTYENFKLELEELGNNYCAMGRKYGVSDNAIRKWEKSYKKYGF